MDLIYYMFVTSVTFADFKVLLQQNKINMYHMHPLVCIRCSNGTMNNTLTAIHNNTSIKYILNFFIVKTSYLIFQQYR